VLRNFADRKAKQQSITTRLRTRRWPWQCSTPSWPAAYNLACAYAALATGADTKTPLDPLVTKVIRSLEFALCNPECEMERPSERICSDPDFSWQSGQRNACFGAFLLDQRNGSTQSMVSQPGPCRPPGSDRMRSAECAPRPRQESARGGGPADCSLLSRPRGAQAGEHPARGNGLCVGAKTRERPRQDGVPEISSKALLTRLTA
jgi:hypothetical protein